MDRGHFPPRSDGNLPAQDPEGGQVLPAQQRGHRRNMKPNKNLLIGLGVYPQASYFNHSCHPRTARYNIGKKLVLKALTPFQTGEEVSENYGQVFYFKSKQERQRELEARYWFSCECPACKEDW